jgi:hypothetical protein
MHIEPAIDRSLLAQVDRIAADRQNLAFLLHQPADRRRTNHAAMAGDEYPTIAERKRIVGASQSFPAVATPRGSSVAGSSNRGNRESALVSP